MSRDDLVVGLVGLLLARRRGRLGGAGGNCSSASALYGQLLAYVPLHLVHEHLLLLVLDLSRFLRPPTAAGVFAREALLLREAEGALGEAESALRSARPAADRDSLRGLVLLRDLGPRCGHQWVPGAAPAAARELRPWLELLQVLKLLELRLGHPPGCRLREVDWLAELRRLVLRGLP